jgi:hypothetical protein
MLGQQCINYFQWRYCLNVNPSTAPGTSITPGSGSKGSWYQLASGANLAQDVYEIIVWVFNGNTTATVRDIIMDIGVDPAGGTSYNVLLADILVSQASNAVDGGRWFRFPIFIKGGSSVGVRGRASNTTAFYVQIQFFGRPSAPDLLRVGQYSETMGASGNGGTGINVGNTGAEGSWVQLGTTTRALWYMTLCVGCSNGTTTSNRNYFDLAIGDASTKIIIVENLPAFLPGTAERTGNPMLGHAYWKIPASTNVYARGACQGTAVTGWQALAIGIGG